MPRLAWFWLILGLAACAQPSQPAALTDADVLFYDSFAPGETGAWLVEGDEAGRTAVVDEQLQIQIDAPNVLQFTTLREPSFSDFVLEVDARQLAGDPQGSYGILFRMQDTLRFYRFEITGSGLFMIERRNADGSWTRFVEDWTPAPAVAQGLGSLNRLRVEAAGSDLRFYVNETLLQQVTDGVYTAGTLGFDAGTFGQPGLVVAFDNLVVRRP